MSFNLILRQRTFGAPTTLMGYRTVGIESASIVRGVQLAKRLTAMRIESLSKIQILAEVTLHKLVPYSDFPNVT